MSIVGPRPLFEKIQNYLRKYMRRLNVLPGITGLLQINEEILLNLKLGINMILNILKIGTLFRFKNNLKNSFCFI